MTSNDLLDELLIAASDDWLHVAEIASIARELSTSGGDDARAAAVDTFRVLLGTGLLKAGDVTQKGWVDSELSDEEALARTKRAIEALQAEPWPDEALWFRLTDRGHARVREILEARGPRVYRPDELDELFALMSRDGERITDAMYPGILLQLPDSKVVGLRHCSAYGGPAIDSSELGRPRPRPSMIHPGGKRRGTAVVPGTRVFPGDTPAIECAAASLLIDGLFDGLFDWLHVGYIHWAVEEFVGRGRALSTRRLTSAASAAVALLLNRGDIKVGTVNDRKGFEDWALAQGDVVERFERDWRLLGRDPLPGEVCWIRLTARGEERARQIRSVDPRSG